MCFMIAPKAARWRNRVVYKYVMGFGATRWRPAYWGIGTSLWYRLGQVFTAIGARTTSDKSAVAGGVYVHSNLASARRKAKQYEDGVVLKLQVSPQDFLYSGMGSRSTEATYDKVKVLGVAWRPKRTRAPR